VRQVFGMHNWPGIPVGAFAVREGPTMAMADEFEITITGVGGHAAKPDLARDPIIAGAALVQALQTIVSRRIDPVEPAVISVTTFHAGDAHNVIPGVARLGGTVRTFSETLHAAIREEITRQCAQIGAAYGVSIAYAPSESVYPPVLNDPETARFAGAVLDGLAGRDRVTHGHPPVMGSEDFSFFAKTRPGAFIFCGTGDVAPLHHPEYDFNDATLPWGVAYWCRLAEAALPREA
jgi:hippurate hydrolase